MSALSLVIKQLSEGEGFVNFRDSKLTHILRASLGGNARTAIICNVTPTVLDETSSTLKFACSAKAVQNQPHVNEVLSDQVGMKKKQYKHLSATNHFNSSIAGSFTQVQQLYQGFREKVKGKRM